MERDHYEEGVPSWVDLSTPDPAAAAEFYTALFGWEAPEGAPEFGGYRVCTLRGSSVCGLGPQMAPGPPHWTTYVNTASADEVVARASGAGGQVLMPPMDVGDTVRMALVADPAGAVIGVMQPGTTTGAQVVNEPDAWCWSELATTDTGGAMAWYPSVFGWEAAPSPADGPLQYYEWKVGGASVAGMMPQPEGMPAGMPPAWGVYFAVADTDAALARIGELGGGTIVAPTDIPIGRFAVAHDPAGAVFSVIALAS